MQPVPYAPPAGPPPAPKKMPVWVIVLIVVAGGALVLLITLGSLAIFGMRRYLAAAKTSEAKSTIGAIARGARASYDRESLGEGGEAAHRLCKSAVPVPSRVPSGVKYQPAASGADFDTGDAETGWKCLRFSITQPIYYQYHYQQGSGYVVPSTDPGPDGFEAAAVGDLDGDGETSIFSVTGRVTGGAVVQSPTIHIENEVE